MKASRMLLVTSLLMLAGGTIHAQSIRMLNIAAILDTPFLHQEQYPLRSEYEGTFFEEVVYTYEEIEGFDRPLPTKLSSYDFIEEPLGEVLVSYSNGELAQLIYSGDGFRDTYTYTEFGPHGPTRGTIETMEGDRSETRLFYDDAGYIVRLEEEDPYNPGALWYIIEYRWGDTPEGVRPSAMRVMLPGNRDEYTRFLYDTEGKLKQLYGRSYYDDELEPNTYTKTYFYQDDETRSLFD